MLQLITRQSKTDNAIHEWVYNFGAMIQNEDGDMRKIYKKLVALGTHPKPDDVNDAIGNDTWTDIECMACGDAVEKAVVIQLTDDETIEICAKCVKKMQALLK